MKIFKGQNLLEFAEQFQTDENCKEYLSVFKWEQGFKCVKCGYHKSQVRKDFSRTCNKCSHTESATANTLFHKVKFGVRKAFFICFEMSTSTKGLSANYIGSRYGITEKTARMFMHKVREAMKPGGKYPMEGNVHVDEFVAGGKEEGKPGRSYDSKKKKAVCAVELTDRGKIKRMYVLRIDNFSAKQLRPLFDLHIDPQARVTTDEWKGYRPIMKDFNIEQIKSNNGLNFIALHTMIHQVKSWLRTTFAGVSDKHIQKYFNEFCYRLNRSQSKSNIFNNLIKRMADANKLYQAQLICT